MTYIASTKPLAASMSTMTAPTIELTKTEEALCVLLDDACRWIQIIQPQPDPLESGGVQVTYYQGWSLEARIAGGWVRDKLLGQDSHDLDISLSTLTGHIFALLLRSYLLSPDFAASKLANEHGSPFHSSSTSSDHLVGHITRIAANPEQSKNLETATAKVAGLQLDFVNLRKEVYVGNSRIPTMTFGTAQEDAERRDITINTLFYNVHVRQVEDFTGLGLSDLKNKIIRTPLSPQQTFLDDPLRVLRCVRFSSRFGYMVHDDIVECFKGKEGVEILEALRCKVSRERFGTEVDKMMRGPNPLKAIELMFQLSLHDVIFNPPPGSVLSGASILSSTHVLEASRLVDKLWKKARRRNEGKDEERCEIDLPDNVLATLLNEDCRRLLFYNASLLHLYKVKWEEKRRKFFGADECVLSIGLKLPVHNTRKPIAEMDKAAELLSSPTPESFSDSDPDYKGRHIQPFDKFSLSPQSTVALLIRKPCITNMDLGLSVELCLLWTYIQDSITSDLNKIGKGQYTQRPAKIYSDFYSMLQKNGLLDRVHEKILLDGKEVLKLLNIKPSKDVQIILKRVEAWQFDRNIPDGKREEIKEECKEWLIQEWSKGNILPHKS